MTVVSESALTLDVVPHAAKARVEAKHRVTVRGCAEWGVELRLAEDEAVVSRCLPSGLGPRLVIAVHLIGRADLAVARETSGVFFVRVALVALAVRAGRTDDAVLGR